MNRRTEYKFLEGVSERNGQRIKYEIAAADECRPATFRIYMERPEKVTHPFESSPLEPVITMQIGEAQAFADDINSMLNWLSSAGGLVNDVYPCAEDAKGFRYGSSLNK